MGRRAKPSMELMARPRSPAQRARPGCRSFGFGSQGRRLLESIVWLALTVSALACSGRRDHDYATYAAKNENGSALRWTRSQIVLQPIRPKQKVDEATLRGALGSEITAWNGALASCRAPRFRVAAPVDAARVRRDGVSHVVVRTVEWCPDGASLAHQCYDPTIAALTHVYPNDNRGSADDGTLIEADIEINAVRFSWSLDGEVAGTRSLRAVLAHELGHALGLDHACSTAQSRLEQRETSAPPCTGAGPSVARSIMYPNPLELGRTAVLQPGPSEVDFLCSQYERAELGGKPDVAN